jgi:predicted O-methyltransferase YrrM
MPNTCGPIQGENMKNREALINHFAELGFTKGAEIGVAQGNNSERMLKLIPNLELICVDCYGKGWAPYMEATRERLAPYNATLIVKKSVDAAPDVPDGSLDFVYIDAEHSYKSVKEDIAAWAPKVRTGGIVSGHDYYVTKKGNTGVIQAVDEFVAEHGYKLNLTEWDRRNPSRDEWQPSWWVVV